MTIAGSVVSETSNAGGRALTPTRRRASTNSADTASGVATSL